MSPRPGLLALFKEGSEGGDEEEVAVLFLSGKRLPPVFKTKVFEFLFFGLMYSFWFWFCYCKKETSRFGLHLHVCVTCH